MIYSASRLLASHTREESSPVVNRSSNQASLLSRAGMAIWHGLEDIGQARAHRQLRMMADRCSFSDPELSRQLRAASSYDSTSRGHKAATSSQPLATPAGAAQA